MTRFDPSTTSSVMEGITTIVWGSWFIDWIERQRGTSRS